LPQEQAMVSTPEPTAEKKKVVVVVKKKVVTAKKSASKVGEFRVFRTSQRAHNCRKNRTQVQISPTRGKKG